MSNTFVISDTPLVSNNNPLLELTTIVNSPAQRSLTSNNPNFRRSQRSVLSLLNEKTSENPVSNPLN